MKTNLKMSFTGGVKNRFFGVVALFTVVAFGVLFTACGGGGGGGGGGSASNASGTTWGGKTTITIPFGGGTGRASVSDGFKKLGCTSIDLTVTQTANGTSEVIYKETISPDEDVTIEVVTGSKIDAVATLIIQDKNPRTATGSIDRVATGKNTLTLYVPYKYSLVDDTGTVLESGEYTSRDGLLLPSSYVTPDNIKIITKFRESTPDGKTYPLGRRYDITGDIELKAEISLLTAYFETGKWYIGCDPGDLGSTVTIPAKVGDKTIYGIGGNYFDYKPDLQTVIIENGIESIGTDAFEECNGLTSVSLPASLTQIGDNAFNGTGLTAINLPSDLTKIGNNAFAYCSALGGRVTIPGGVTSIGTGAFTYSGAYSNPMQVVIERGVQSIGDNAFKSSNVSSVTLPEDLETIGDYAFSGTNISSITIPNSVTTIGSYALVDCAQLQEVYMPVYASPIELGSLFSGCTNLTDIYFTTDDDPPTFNPGNLVASNITIHYASLDHEAWITGLEDYGFNDVIFDEP